MYLEFGTRTWRKSYDSGTALRLSEGLYVLSKFISFCKGKTKPSIAEKNRPCHNASVFLLKEDFQQIYTKDFTREGLVICTILLLSLPLVSNLKCLFSKQKLSFFLFASKH